MTGSLQKAVLVKFTNGEGNNIFRYIYGRLLAERRGCRLLSPALPALDIPAIGCSRQELKEIERDGKALILDMSAKDKANFHVYFDHPENVNIVVKAYPEDFTLYTPAIDHIRSWFPEIPMSNRDDLVMHLRLGDRLVMAGTYKNGNDQSPAAFIKAISQFDFKRLHIVTDMPVWRPVTQREVEEFTFHRRVQSKDRISPETSAQYFNSLYGELSKFDPVVRVGNSLESDFAYMRGFDKILFQHGTLAWWAAALSHASKVGVLKRWRGGKECNLGWTDLPGWFGWGPDTAPSRQVKEYHLINLVKEHGLKTFVETGTKGGTTLKRMTEHCSELYSVELMPDRFNKARSRLPEHVNLYLGNSAEKLKEILPKIKKPALFWLDAHSETFSPVLAELELILSQQPALPHVLVIDDLRLFGRPGLDFPSVDEVKALVDRLAPAAVMDTKFDTIRIFLGKGR